MDDYMHSDKIIKLEVDVSNDSSHDPLHVDVNSNNSEMDPSSYQDNDFLSQKYIMNDNKEYVLTDSTNGHYNGVNYFDSKFNINQNNNNNSSTPKPSEALFIHALLSRCKRLAPLWFKGALSMREKNRKEHKRGYTVSGVQTSSSWSAVVDKISEMSCRAETEMVMNLLKKLYKELASDSIIWFIKCWLKLPETKGDNSYNCVLSRGDARGRMRRIDGGKGSDKVWRLDTIVSMLYHGMPMSSTDTNIIVHTCDQELCVRPQHLRFRASAVALAVVLKALQQGGYQLIPPSKKEKEKEKCNVDSGVENGQDQNNNRSGSPGSNASVSHNHEDEIENSVEISGPFNIEQLQHYLIEDLKPCVQSLEKMVLSATDRSILCANPDLDHINNSVPIVASFDSPRTFVHNDQCQSRYKAYQYEKSSSSRPIKRIGSHLASDGKSPNSYKRGRIFDRKTGSKSPPLLLTDHTPATTGYLKNVSAPIPTMNSKLNNAINPHMNGCNVNGLSRPESHSMTNSFPNFYPNHSNGHNPPNHHPSMNMCSPNSNHRYMYQSLVNQKSHSNPFHHNIHHPFISGTGSHTFPPLFHSSSNVPDPSALKHHGRFSPLVSSRHGSVDHGPISLTPTKSNRHCSNSNVVHPVSVPYYNSSHTPSIFPFRNNPFETMPPLGFTRFPSPKRPHFNNVHRPIPEPAASCVIPKLGNAQKVNDRISPVPEDIMPVESFNKSRNESEKNSSPNDDDRNNFSPYLADSRKTNETPTSSKSKSVTPSQTPRKPAKKRLEARTPTYDITCGGNGDNGTESSLDFSSSTGSAFRLVHKSKIINTSSSIDNSNLSNITDSIKADLGTDETELANILTKRSKVDKALSKKVSELSGQLFLQKHKNEKASENKCSGSGALLNVRNSNSAHSGQIKDQSSHLCTCHGNEEECISANGYPGNCCSSAASRTSVKSYSASAQDAEMFVPFNFVFSGVSRSTPINQTTPSEPKSSDNDSVNGMCARLMGSFNNDRINSGQAHLLLNAIRNSPMAANCTELMDLLSSMVQQYGIASGSNINTPVDLGSAEQTRSESRILAHIYQRLCKNSPSDRTANQLLQKNYSFSPLSTEVDLNYLRAAAAAHHNGPFNTKVKSRHGTSMCISEHHRKNHNIASRSDSCTSFETNNVDSVGDNRSRFHSSDNPGTAESNQPVTVSTTSLTSPDNGPVSSCSAFSAIDTQVDADLCHKRPMVHDIQ